MGRHTGKLGAAGEQVAVRHLEARGMRVLARNWRCSRADVRGELDIVARDGDCLVVCEVKARRGTASGGPLEAITPRKLLQLRRLAAAYLTASGEHAAGVRIDAVGVCWPPGGGTPDVTHVRGILA